MTAFAMKAAPALASGNVIVTKCSEFNPLSSLRLAELAIEAGFPPGVLNVVVGTIEAGETLSSHMKIRKISFTGSTAVGKQVQLAASNSNLKRVSLELGGKSPVIIFQDADIEQAIAESSQNILALNGQGCILGTRVYVHESLADRYLEGMKQILESSKASLGKSPLDQNTTAAPLAHVGQLNRVLAFLEKGKKEAQLITGGSRFGTIGCYVEPTIFFQPKVRAEISTKEIFGPVLCVETFTDEEAVIIKANDSEYGLGAYVYTRDLDRAFRLSASLEAGTVMVNNASIMDNNLPYGGFKSKWRRFFRKPRFFANSKSQVVVSGARMVWQCLGLLLRRKLLSSRSMPNPEE
jgi:aldehyde dehydrogenase (NAD+)